MVGITEKAGGVRRGGSDTSPTWHTTATLKALNKAGQIVLAGKLANECQGTLTKSAFKTKVATRWRGPILTMLAEAETAWRARARLPVVKLVRKGSLVKRFVSFADSFFPRLRKGRLLAALADAKRKEGSNAPKPQADGLDLKGTTKTVLLKRQSLATAALAATISSPKSLFRALTALKRAGTVDAEEAALSEDPERAYLSMLTKATALVNDDDSTNSESGDDDETECGRVGCTQPAVVKYTYAKTDEYEELPLCTKCHGEGAKALLASNKRKKPGHPAWLSMMGTWVTENPISDETKCWTCNKMVQNSDIVSEMVWCLQCSLAAVKTLKTVSGGECKSWDCKWAETYLGKVKQCLQDTSKPAVGTSNPEPRSRASKRPRPETVDLKGRDVDSEGEDIDGLDFDNCTLCCIACGDDRLGRLSKTVPVLGVPVFHSKCRARMLKWWKGDKACQASVATLRMSSRSQWAHIVAKAQYVAAGSSTLEEESADAKGDLVDALLGVGNLKSAAGSGSEGLFALAKMIRGNESGAKLSPEHRREFGLDSFPWDLRDLAVENAKRRTGSFRSTQVKNREMERDEFIWWLMEGTAADAASCESGRDLMQQAEESGASRRYR